MFNIDKNKNIEVTRGNMLTIRISPKNKDKTDYTFEEGDIVRFSIYKNKNCRNVVFQKDFTPEIGNTYIDITLTAEETKIGDLINEPVKYCYEVELRPETLYTQTIIGYSSKGATYFILLPEAGDKN